VTVPRPLLGVHIAGRRAVLLDRYLPDAVRAHREVLALEVALGRSDGWELHDLDLMLAEIAAAADAYRLWRASAFPETPPPSAEAARSSPGEIGSETAAAVIGVSDSRVRQLARAGVLPGRKTDGGRWLVDVAAAREYGEMRRRGRLRGVAA
jgi:hypothetical protein